MRKQFPETAADAVITPLDGAFAITGGDDGTIRFWKIDGLAGEK